MDIEACCLALVAAYISGWIFGYAFTAWRRMFENIG